MQEKKFDFVLFAYFALWYLGNYYYNITNKSGRLSKRVGAACVDVEVGSDSEEIHCAATTSSIARLT